jgi:hypothetical protein
LASFEDIVMPATDFGLEIKSSGAVRSVNIRTADADATSGPLKFQAVSGDGSTFVSTKIPRLDISAMILIEP